MPVKTILLAEDDADDRDFFQDVLQSRTDVTLFSTAENGEEVFDALGDNDNSADLPDFILLDQNMPKRNGLQTLQLLKQNKDYQAIPVFIYSTYADEMIREQSIAAGAVSVFSKPYTGEGYHEMIDNMLNLIE